MKFKLIQFLLILCLGFSCRKENKNTFQSIEVIGHAATGLKIQNSVYHDNSKEAVEFSLAMDGCDGVEIDVQLSKDNNLWLFHDVDLSVETNCQGCISSLEDDILETVHYKTSKKEKLTKLEELDFSKIKNKKVMLDVRHYNPCESKIIDITNFLQALNKIEGLKNENVYVLLSINEWIKPFSLNGYKTIISLNSYDEIGFDVLSETYGVILKNKGITKEQVQLLHNKNKKVYIFDIRAPKETRRAFEKNPDGLVTDDIRTALIEKN